MSSKKRAITFIGLCFAATAGVAIGLRLGSASLLFVASFVVIQYVWVGLLLCWATKAWCWPLCFGWPVILLLAARDADEEDGE